MSTQFLARVCRRHKLLAYVACEPTDILKGSDDNGTQDIPPFTSWLGKGHKYEADVVESVIGAYFVDCGYNFEKTQKFLHEFVGVVDYPFVPNPKMLLQEFFPGADVLYESGNLIVNGNKFVFTQDVVIDVGHHNWKCVVAAHACEMLKANPSLKEKLNEKT